MCVSQYHPGLSGIPAPIGSEEVMLLSRAFTPKISISQSAVLISCDPTGAGILDNQGWYSLIDAASIKL